VIDQQTNALSVFNMMQVLDSATFPFQFPGFTIASIFTRDLLEAEHPEGVRLKMYLQGKQIADFELVIQFQGRTYLRHLVNVRGLAFEEPGELRVSVFHNDREIGYWPILIRKTEAPAAQPAAS
jgi:hypothetical protein